jgi:poly(3-hydroxybutyrate) depolymerase
MRMRAVKITLIFLTAVLFSSPLMADSFTYKGKKRTYVVSAPRSKKKLGVFVLLHCNGGNGSIAVGRWAKIVHLDGVMCVGPNSLNRGAAWRDQENGGIDFIKALVDEVAKKYKIDRKRIYLGGYSAGACQSCRVGIPNSDYFAGIITYAGSSGPALGPRKIPVALVHGERDGNIKVDGSRRLHQMLKEAGWPVRYWEIPGQGHGYNAKHNKQAWEWVKKHPPKDPPEVVSKRKLGEAKEALDKKQYEKAYKAYNEALETGVNKEDAQTGIKKIKLSEKKPENGSTPEDPKEKSEDTQKEQVEKAKVTPEELMKKADKYVESGMKDAARQYLQRILDDFPDSPLAEEARQKLEEIEE